MREVVERPDGTRVSRVTADDDVRYVDPAPRGNMASNIVSIIGGILMVLLGLRVLLSLLGANRENAFADFIYGITYPFAAPFFGLFGYDVQYGVSRLEVETIFAIIIYALIFFGIARLLNVRRDSTSHA